MAAIRVSPQVSAFDSDLSEFKVVGLRPGRNYFISLRLQHKSTFRSFARFTASDDGEIDVARDVAVHGHYHGADIMGLFSSLYHEPTANFGTTFSLKPMPKSLEYVITVHEVKLFTPGKAVAECKITRLLQAPHLERTEIKSEIEGVLFKPPGDGPFPSVIDVYGMLGMAEHRAALLAAKGFAVLALTVFGGETTPSIWQKADVHYFLRAADWLLAQRFASRTLGLVGISAGGSAVLHTAIRHEKISASIVISSAAHNIIHSVLCENGRPMPYYDAPPAAFRHINFEGGAFSYNDVDTQFPAPEELQLKIEQAAGKIMLIAGAEDKSMASVHALHIFQQRMNKANRSADLEVHLLPHTGHNIEPPFVPVQDLSYSKPIDLVLAYGGHPYKQNVEQRKMWPKMVAFLRRNIDLGSDKHKL